VTAATDVAALVTLCQRNLALEVSLGDEYRYAHLSFCVIDAVFSIGVRYESTQAVVERYAEWAQLVRNRPADAFPARDAQQPLTVLVEHIEQIGAESFAADVVKNRQRTSTRNGVLKSEAVAQFASVLVAHDVLYLQDVAAKATDKQLDDTLRAVRGQGSGISIAYFFMLAGDDGLVKPDRMLQRFVCRALERPVTLEEIQPLVAAACEQLRQEHRHLNPRVLDHAIWNYERSQ
jgi:hypothetical protein